jgi:hypothetical protein
MKLTQLAAKPTLVKITLDEEKIVQAYGEPLEFWVYDRQDLDSFVKIATLDVSQFDKLASFINTMILDEDGNPVVKEGFALPNDVMMAAIQKVVDALGKPQSSILRSIPQK